MTTIVLEGAVTSTYQEDGFVPGVDGHSISDALQYWLMENGEDSNFHPPDTPAEPPNRLVGKRIRVTIEIEDAASDAIR